MKYKVSPGMRLISSNTAFPPLTKSPPDKQLFPFVAIGSSKTPETAPAIIGSDEINKEVELITPGQLKLLILIIIS